MANSPLDLVMFYADLGRPYLPLIRAMTKSARREMPDNKLILLTPTPSEELCSLFDEHIWLKITSTGKTVCYDKARAIVTWQANMKRECVFVDPDLQFRKPLEFPDADVGLLWRDKIAHPINTGMIFAKPGSPKFWKRYGNTVASLPGPLHSWWGDQIAFSTMFGALHKPGETIAAWDASVRLMDWTKVCTTEEHATEETWAIHYKGIRKGQGWEPYFTPPPKSGVGKLSLVSA